MSKYIIIDRDTKEQVLTIEFLTRKSAEFYLNMLSKFNRVLEISEVKVNE